MESVLNSLEILALYGQAIVVPVDPQIILSWLKTSRGHNPSRPMRTNTKLDIVIGHLTLGSADRLLDSVSSVRVSVELLGVTLDLTRT